MECVKNVDISTKIEYNEIVDTLTIWRLMMKELSRDLLRVSRMAQMCVGKAVKNIISQLPRNRFLWQFIFITVQHRRS